MTKISIQPNASGTGTFTLTAPDSNDNRTFTLPDATGNLVSADPVLGFADMPLVDGNPVVESDSNSDGEYTRWADGTQVVSQFFQTDRLDTQSSGTSFQFDWSYPKIFSESPFTSVSGTHRSANESDRYRWGVRTGEFNPPRSIDELKVYFYMVSSTGTAQRAHIDCIAYGRWF